jgi:hypothetical protein
MSNDKVTCPSCGGTHGPELFTKELRALWRRVQDATSEEERFELMVKLSEQFISDVSDTDEGIDDDWHALIADVVESRLAFEKHSLVLARVLLRSIPHAVSTSDDEEPVTTRRQPDKSKAN